MGEGRENREFGFAETNRERLRENLWKAAERFRHEYIDDLPPEQVTKDDPKYKLYKCRVSFFNDICMYLGLVLKDDFIQDQQSKQKVIDFIEYYAHVRPKVYGMLYAQSDIDTVNNILDVVAFELKKE